MSHIVVYQASDGSSGYEPCDSLDAAIVVAERMRNSEGVDSPRIFRMEEVEFDFRPYYRVEVAGAAVADSPEPEEISLESPAEEPVVPSWSDSKPSEPEVEPLVYTLPDEQPAEDVTEEPEPEVEPDDSFTDEVVGANPFDTLEVPGESDMPPPPEGDVVGPDDEGSDPMISVRRGLFGR